MNLFGEIIKAEGLLLSGLEPRELSYSKGWKDDGNNGIILRQDMAYELGGGEKSAVTLTLMTEDSEVVNKNELLLYGPDLPEIKTDVSYARIVLLKVRENSFSEDKLYNEISKVTYSRYHVHPYGFMPRISSVNRREPVRVGKAALKGGLDFSRVASMYLDEFLKDPHVEFAKVIFITLPDFDYERLDKLSEKTSNVIAALDEMLKNLLMDCHSCKLKPVCDEVEGMRELHFNASGGKKD